MKKEISLLRSPESVKGVQPSISRSNQSYNEADIKSSLSEISADLD
jgi:hypothetical protein